MKEHITTLSMESVAFPLLKKPRLLRPVLAIKLTATVRMIPHILVLLPMLMRHMVSRNSSNNNIVQGLLTVELLRCPNINKLTIKYKNKI